MSLICPTVTADNLKDYQQQLNTNCHLTNRLHIDLADQTIAPRNLVSLGDISWTSDMIIDLHLMLKANDDLIKLVIKKKPHLAIFHYYSDIAINDLALVLRPQDIKFGIALPPGVPIEALGSDLSNVDHLLIFSGNLGYQGGSSANLDLLSKVTSIRRLKPEIEIGWDGGINDQNITSLARSGIDVLNVGGYLSNSDNPQLSYAKLKELI